MGFVSVDEIHQGRDGSIGLNASRDYTRTWRVFTDDAQIGASEVIFAPGIPDYLTPYYTPTWHDNYALLVDKSARQGSTRLEWLVTCRYSTNIGVQNPSNLDNPLSEAPEIEWDTIESDDWITGKDAEPIEYLNSAGQPLDDGGIRGFATYQVLRYSANRADYSPSVARTYHNAINSDPFYGAPPHTCLLKKWRGQRKVTGNAGGSPIYFWRHEFEIWFYSEGWSVFVLDAGAMELKNGKLTAYIDPETGVASTVPQPLNGHGRFLAPGGEPVYLELSAYSELPFSALGIV